MKECTSFLGGRRLIGVWTVVVFAACSAAMYGAERGEQKRIGFWFTDSAGRRWAFVGFLYGALVGAASGWLLAWVYNRVADRRARWGGRVL